MGALTDFGNSAVVLPLACVICLWMFFVEVASGGAVGWRGISMRRGHGAP